jgi:hypothetical protein
MLSRLHSLLQRSSSINKQTYTPFTCSAQQQRGTARCPAVTQQQITPSTSHYSLLQQQQQRPGVAMFSAASPAAATEPQASAAADTSLICTSITASTVEAFLQEIQEASSTGAQQGRGACEGLHGQQCCVMRLLAIVFRQYA